MKPIVGFFFACVALFAHVSGSAHAQSPTNAAGQERRVAFVVGNAAYQTPLATTANDAGLIAQTLQAAGFDVVGARDLDGETLRRSFKDFIQKVQTSGPDTVAVVYLAGYGLQLSGENYFAPIDAKIIRDTDVPVEALRISDYTRQLSALPIKASIIVLDAARLTPFAKEGQPLAGGLSLVEPDPKMLIAFNAAPGTVTTDGTPPYGVYAQALAEMIRAGGIPLPELFERVRLRVNELTKGAEIPWNAQRLEGNFIFFERAPNAPQPAGLNSSSALRSRPIREFNAADAYTAAIQRDTIQDYEAFLVAFPDDPLAARVRAIMAARREAVIWRRSYRIDTPQAFWSYLDRYPRGPHAYDARRRLAILAAALAPPPSFVRVIYDVPPPPPDEIVYVDRPVLYFSDPVFAFVPPPPPPIYFLPPPPPDFVVLAPPPPPIGLFVLPTPLFVAIPAYVSPPAYVALPPNNIIFTNIHNTTIINTVINRPAAPAAAVAPASPANPGPQAVRAAPAPAPVAVPAAVSQAAPPAAAVSLPSAVAQKSAALSRTPSVTSVSGTKPDVLAAPVTPNAAIVPRALPGSNGQTLPKPSLPAALPTPAPVAAIPAAKPAGSSFAAPLAAAPKAAALTAVPQVAAPTTLARVPVNRAVALPPPPVVIPKNQPRAVAIRPAPVPPSVKPNPPSPPRIAAIRRPSAVRPPPMARPPAPRPQAIARVQAPRPQAVARVQAPRPQAVARVQAPRPAPGPRPPCKGNACKR